MPDLPAPRAPPDWRSLDAASLERAYSPSSCIGGNYQPCLQDYARRSAQAHATLSVQTHRYGDRPAQLLDLFLPPPGAGTGPPPLLVFLHGGYWQELGKDASAFAAIDGVQQGIALAVIGYTLAPQATLPQIVGECRQALRWLQARAGALGFEARHIVVAGSSAGAHLAAMVALPSADGEAPVTGLAGTVLVSGIFDLAPLLTTSINAALGLTLPVAEAMSPALRPLRGLPPSVVCWGEVETDEFKRQSRDLAAALAAAGTPCQAFEVPGRNHFDIVLDLARPGTPLGDAVLALLRGEPAASPPAARLQGP